MEEPNYKLVKGSANTVKELIELLKQVPGDYQVTLSGLYPFGVLMDTKNKTTLIDDINYIYDLLDE